MNTNEAVMFPFTSVWILEIDFHLQTATLLNVHPEVKEWGGSAVEELNALLRGPVKLR